MKLAHRRQFLHLAAGAAALPAVPRVARAQAYPTRPITMVVPFPAGGAIDALGRILAEPMTAALGQAVVIEDVGGAGGSIGVGRVARAAPDGYTLSLATADQFVANGAIYPLQYDIVKDFEPIALLAGTPYLIVSNNGVPAKDLKDLIAWLTANHAKVSQGHVGVGGSMHLCGLVMQKVARTQWQMVPYRGATPALQDIVGGQIDVMCPLPGSGLGLVRSGKLRAYAVAADTRLASAPEIPTVDEAGFPGMYISGWACLFAPRGTPKDVIAKLNAVVVTVLADLGVRRRISELGMEYPPREQQTPEALRAFQKAEIEKWWPIIKAANIKGE
jgi:tripartite-type tricarboxylate transporter receptor subunit TctC